MNFLKKLKYRKSIIKSFLIKRKIFIKTIVLPNKDKVDFFTVELTYKPALLKAKGNSFNNVIEAEKQALKALNEKYQEFLKENPDYYYSCTWNFGKKKQKR